MIKHHVKCIETFHKISFMVNYLTKLSGEARQGLSRATRGRVRTVLEDFGKLWKLEIECGIFQDQESFGKR